MRTTRPIDNVTLVRNMMESSATGAIKHVFILEAIRHFSQIQVNAPDWTGVHFISQDAWRKCAAECLESMNTRELSGIPQRESQIGENMKTFGSLAADDEFISPEGSLCCKISSTKARMLDKEDNVFKVGEWVTFAPGEVVEYCPKVAA